MSNSALLAIAFAAGMLSSQLPALCDNNPETTLSLIQRVSENEGTIPEDRALDLLALARVYLTEGCDPEVEAKYAYLATRKSPSFRRSNFWENSLVHWSDLVSAEAHTARDQRNSLNIQVADAKNATDANLAHANMAVQRALLLASQVPNGFARLNLYYIAARLYERAGNMSGMRKCDNTVESALKASERISPIDQEQIKAAISILDSMSNGFIKASIPLFYQTAGRQVQIKPFSEKDFVECEKLKRRAVTIADRLPASDHVRRKAHRDLVLWYIQLGKTEKAEAEKRILFELVGFKDDSVLYPQSRGCGSLVWWQKEKITGLYGCGMG